MWGCFQLGHDGGGAGAEGSAGIWHWPGRSGFPFRFAPTTMWGRRMMRTTASFRRLHVAYFLFFSAAGLLAVWQLSSGSSAAARQLAPMDALYLAVSALTVTGLSPVAIQQLPAPVHVSLLLLMTLGSQVVTSAIPLFIRSAVSTHSISRISLRLLRNHSQHSSSSSSSSPSHSPCAAAPRLDDGSLPKHTSSCKPTALGAAPMNPHRHRNEDEEVEVDSPLPSTSKTVKRAVSLPAMPTSKSCRHETEAAQQLQAVQQLTELLWWHKKKGLARAQQQQQQQPSAAAAAAASRADGDDPVVHEAGQQEKGGNTTGAPPAVGPPVAGLMEHEALVLLSWTVCTYWVVMQGLGFVVSLACVLGTQGSRQLLKARGVLPVFFALFATVSAFANAGLSLLNDNLVALQGNAPFLLWMCVLILLGNTLYAPALRLLLFCLYKLHGGNPNADDEHHHHPGTLTLTLTQTHPALVADVRSRKKLRRRIALRYLLTSPRRCFTHLFPRTDTLWLVLTVLVLNVTQLIDISILDWHGPVFSSLPSDALKLVNALFTSITTRNAGLNVVNIAAFSAPTLVLLAVMMYIAVYPVYLSRERSKEQVGISLTGDSSRTGAGSKERMISQFRALLARDSLYLFIAMFCICLTERNSIQEDPLNFSIFNILFEIISAYGNVGLSLGYSCGLQLASSKDECVDVSYSFSGKWSKIGKLVLVGVMLLGRHRALPDDLDWAISLPSYN